jgi:transposase
MLGVGMEADMTRNQRTGRGVQGKPGRRYELTDEAYARIQPLLPTQTRGGRWNDHRVTLNGIFWILNAGAQWRDLPERYGKWESVYHRYQRWTRDGLFDRILQRLHLELDAEGRIDWSAFNVDGSSIRADRSAAGARKKSGRTSPSTTPWDDPAEALARSFIW